MTDTTTDSSNDAQLPDTIEIDSDDSNTVVDAREFLSMLESFDQAVEAIAQLQNEVEQLNTGLDEEDAIRLIYGRTQFSLSDVRSFFDTIDTIEGADERKLLKRLLADLGNDRLEDADEFLDEVERLRKKYGDLEVEG